MNAHPSQWTMNLEFLKRKSEQYPYQCRISKRRSPKPHDMDGVIDDEFIAVPFETEVIWGFRDAGDASRFVNTYIKHQKKDA